MKDSHWSLTEKLSNMLSSLIRNKSMLLDNLNQYQPLCILSPKINYINMVIKYYVYYLSDHKPTKKIESTQHVECFFLKYLSA